MSASAQHAPGGSGRWLVVILSLLMTLLNSFKPMTVDDAHYYYTARQIALGNALPVSAQMGYYYGLRPLQRTCVPQMQVDVYRVTESYVPIRTRTDHN
jgi:hypothetical protein